MRVAQETHCWIDHPLSLSLSLCVCVCVCVHVKASGLAPRNFDVWFPVLWVLSLSLFAKFA